MRGCAWGRTHAGRNATPRTPLIRVDGSGGNKSPLLATTRDADFHISPFAKAMIGFMERGAATARIGCDFVKLTLPERSKSVANWLQRDSMIKSRGKVHLILSLVKHSHFSFANRNHFRYLFPLLYKGEKMPRYL